MGRVASILAALTLISSLITGCGCLAVISSTMKFKSSLR